MLRIDLRSTDKQIQQQRLDSMLKDAPMKKSLKSLYRQPKRPAKPSQFAMTRSVAPSAFTLMPQAEPPKDSLQLTWRASVKWKEPPPR